MLSVLHFMSLYRDASRRAVGVNPPQYFDSALIAHVIILFSTAVFEIAIMLAV